jgi:hypothetical protein
MIAAIHADLLLVISLVKSEKDHKKLISYFCERSMGSK